MGNHRKGRGLLTVARVGNAFVPVVGAKHASLVRFSAGEHGRQEAGDYLFWTAVLKRSKPPKNRLWGRAYAYLSPGDRFDRMKREMRSAKSRADRAAYRRFWVQVLSRGESIKHIRPSTLAEIRRWMRTHRSDAKFASFALVGGKSFSRTKLFA